MSAKNITWTDEQVQRVNAIIEREFGVESLQFQSLGNHRAVMSVELCKVVPLAVVNEVLRGGK